MLNLWKHFSIHLIRTRIFYFCIILSFVSHFCGLKLVDTIIVYVEEIEQAIQGKHVFMMMFTVSLFICSFMAMVYGTWVVPYLHNGPRAPLTYSLPVGKWKIPIAYAFTFAVLIAIHNTIMFTLHGFIYGYEQYTMETFPWFGLVIAQVFQVICLQVSMFFFALLSLFLGKITSLFVGFMVFGLSQLAGFLFATDLGNELQEGSVFLTVLRKFYEILPPWDAILLRLKEVLDDKPVYDYMGLVPWFVWLAILMAGFVVALRFPFLTKGTD